MTLVEINLLEPQDFRTAVQACCGSTTWVSKMLAARPFSDEEQLLRQADAAWKSCSAGDWKEAFEHHPKIGDLDALRQKFADTAHWAAAEQSSVRSAEDEVLTRLKVLNEAYETKFGYIFIVCATGKSVAEMLAIFDRRLANDPDSEIFNAMEEQQKITQLRLKKMLT